MESIAVPPVVPPVVKKPLDEESLNLLRQRIAQLEVVETTQTTTRLSNSVLYSMSSLADKHAQKERYNNRKLVQLHMLEGSIGSKALPSQFEHKADTTHDITASAVRHHTGSHYHMAGSVQFQKG